MDACARQSLGLCGHPLSSRIEIRHVLLLVLMIDRILDVPWINVVQDYMRRSGQSLVKEPLFYHFGLLLMFIVHPRVFLIMKRYLITLHEIIAKMNRQGLWILHLLFSLLRQVLVIDIFLRHVFYVTSRTCRNLISWAGLVARILALGSSFRFFLLLINSLRLRFITLCLSRRWWSWYRCASMNSNLLGNLLELLLL